MDDKGQTTRRPKGYPGRMAFRAFTAKTTGRKRNPLEQPQQELLAVVLSSERAAQRVMEYAGGDLRNLDGCDVRDLAGIPDMGDGRAARLAAVLALMAQFAAPFAERVEQLEAEIAGLRAKETAAQRKIMTSAA
ncbi:hypothetical protein Mterra_03921 [Calidithermus terrae]|uniref:Uncharacterized protein n=1 Tax=Calidithermus terrae TaxID=1408545 RepID=A0A399E1M0_9DEIN|nr:hypothetical protein [Calidithermus terrae]RIH76012.1 hypothetical protein Mterra_03921 [Calidithermus terrae]